MFNMNPLLMDRTCVNITFIVLYIELNLLGIKQIIVIPCFTINSNSLRFPDRSLQTKDCFMTMDSLERNQKVRNLLYSNNLDVGTLKKKLVLFTFIMKATSLY